MRRGEPTEGIEFYKLLYADDEFCKELGRAVLAAGRLEVELINPFYARTFYFTILSQRGA